MGACLLFSRRRRAQRRRAEFRAKAKQFAVDFFQHCQIASIVSVAHYNRTQRLNGARSIDLEVTEAAGTHLI